MSQTGAAITKVYLLFHLKKKWFRPREWSVCGKGGFDSFKTAVCSPTVVSLKLGSKLLFTLNVAFPWLDVPGSLCSVLQINISSPCDLTHPWLLTTENFLHNKDELLVHLGHPWIHYKHAAIETMNYGLKISYPLLNCCNLAFQIRKKV